jgi:hypothetical protein
MPLRTLLSGFLIWVLYPLWLIAGGIDYLCHRRTHIEHTSGATESRLHVAEFAAVAAIVLPAVLMEITLALVVFMLAAVCLHAVLSFIDVEYTLGRRPIPSLEQHVHGVLNVVPFIAVALLALLHWNDLLSGTALRWKDAPLTLPVQIVLLGSFLILAGTPVIEERFRTQRYAREERLVASSQR